MPCTPPSSDWAKFFSGPSKIFSGDFGASQFRPKVFFGASNNSGSLRGAVPPAAPPPPLWTPPPPLSKTPCLGPTN